jgi:hypothetical protein
VDEEEGREGEEEGGRGKEEEICTLIKVVKYCTIPL